jgi:hypothetical protein
MQAAYVPNGDFALNLVYIKPLQQIVQLATSMPCGIMVILLSLDRSQQHYITQNQQCDLQVAAAFARSDG